MQGGAGEQTQGQAAQATEVPDTARREVVLRSGRHRRWPRPKPSRKARPTSLSRPKSRSDEPDETSDILSFWGLTRRAPNQLDEHRVAA